MRKSALILPFLVISLAIAQTPSELVGELLTNNPMLIISIIVGAVTYIGISRIYSLKEWAPHLAFVVAFSLFLFTTFVEPVQLQFQSFYSPINTGVVSSLGFDLLPLLAVAAILIIVALFFSKFTPGAKGVGYGGMSWRMIAFVVGVIMVIIGSIIGYFINSPVLIAPFVGIGGLLILFAVLGSLMHTATSLTGRGSPRSSPGRTPRSTSPSRTGGDSGEYSGRFNIWVTVVYVDRSSNDQLRWARNPQDENNKQKLLTLPRVWKAKIRIRPLEGWRLARFTMGGETDKQGSKRLNFQKARQYDVHVYGGKLMNVTGRWDDIRPIPVFRGTYDITEQTKRPQIVVPLGAPPVGGPISTHKQAMLPLIDRIRQEFEDFKARTALNIPADVMNKIDPVIKAIKDNRNKLAANAAYRNPPGPAKYQDKTYMKPIWDAIKEFFDELQSRYPPGNVLRGGPGGNLGSAIDQVTGMNAEITHNIDDDSNPDNLINDLQEVVTAVVNTFNVLKTFWTPSFAALPPAQQQQIAYYVNR